MNIIIQAVLVRQTSKSWLLDCEGSVEWFPKSKCSFDETDEALTAPKWLLQEKFPDEQF